MRISLFVSLIEEPKNCNLLFSKGCHKCFYVLLECDWYYKDTDCLDGCVLASPGYPGLYPPNIRCLYSITSGPRMSIAINFTAVLLPEKWVRLFSVFHCTHLSSYSFYILRNDSKYFFLMKEANVI